MEIFASTNKRSPATCQQNVPTQFDSIFKLRFYGVETYQLLHMCFGETASHHFFCDAYNNMLILAG